MNTRLQLFESRCREHLVYRRLAKRISETEFDKIVAFIEDNDHLGVNDFELAINRMYLKEPKTKSWPIVQELLSMTNSALRFVSQRNS